MSMISKYLSIGFLAMALFGFAGCGASTTTTTNSGSNSNTPDATAPTVSSTSPASGATGVAVNTSVTATFSEIMNASTITASFTLSNGTSVSGSVAYNATTMTATFTPIGNLVSNTTYTATVTTAVQDLAGNALSSNQTWSFTTAAGGGGGVGGASTLPDTGQTTCYDTLGSLINCTGTGQNGSYTINPPSYTDNGDGTINDNVTGLMWQKQGDGIGRNWNNAMANCASLSLGGQTGWRLPTRMELIGIANYGAFSPAINTTYFPTTPTAGYWSSTTLVGSSTNSWGVSFGDGYADGGFYRTSFSGGRCVHGTPVTQSYTDNGNGTITDNGTGMIWQKQDDGTLKTWDAALIYCEASTLGGHSDWRLPNIKELSSIVDDTRSNSAINPLFTTTKSSGYWTSTTLASGTSSAWYVEFGLGNFYSILKNSYSSEYVRCVR